MDEDQQILAKAVEWHDAGEQLALATVISTWGSSPRPVGSHMAIRVDGNFVGSVSGGCVENAVVSSALAAIDDDKPAIFETGLSAWRNGLSCGGRISILVHRLTDAEPLRRALSARKRGQACAVGFGLSDGSLTFHPDAEAATSTSERFVRVYRPSPRLVIAGAVHIAEYLSRMAEMAGFEAVVFDPRREFARRGAFDRDPFIGWPDGYFRDHPIDGRTAVVSLTHTAKIDHPTMIAALRSPAFYIGALGSRATHAKRLTRLKGEGFGAADLQRIHGPVGLPIGAGSPAEIAVSILAQLIASWRNGATALPERTGQA